MSVAYSLPASSPVSTPLRTRPAPARQPEKRPYAEASQYPDIRDYMDHLPAEASVLLMPTEEQQLLRLVEQGRTAKTLLDGNLPVTITERARLNSVVQAGKDAEASLVAHNLRLVISIARWYCGQGVPFLDLLQEGNIGLVRGIRHFNLNFKKPNGQPYKLSTYVSWWIRQAITRSVPQQARNIYIPHHVLEEAAKVRKARRALEEERERAGDERAVSTTDIAAYLAGAREEAPGTWRNLPPLAPKEWQARIDHIDGVEGLPETSVYFGQTLSGPRGDNEEGILACLEAPGDVHEDALQRARCQALQTLFEYVRAKNILSERDMEMLARQWGIFGYGHHTLAMLSREFHVTRERVRQITDRAFKKVQEVALKDVALAKMLDL